MKASWDSRHPEGRYGWWSHHRSRQVLCVLSLDAIHVHTFTQSFDQSVLTPALGQAGSWGYLTLTGPRSLSPGALALVTTLRGRREPQ